MHIISLLFLFSGCATMPENPSTTVEVSTATSATAGATSDVTVDGHPDRMVCRSIKQTGSRMTERVCRTAAQWEITSENDRAAIEKVQRDANVNTSSE